MPRTSAESRALQLAAERMQPSSHLSKPEREVWMSVVNSAPADHLTERDRPLLESYCSNAVTQRRLAKLIAALPDDELADATEVKRMESIGKTLAALSNRLKLGPLAMSKTPHQQMTRKEDNTAAPLLGGAARLKAV